MTGPETRSESWPSVDSPDALYECADRWVSEGRVAEAVALCHRILTLDANYRQAHNLLARVRLPGEDYLQVLRRVQELIRPRTYVEIGVGRGSSLAAVPSATRAVGIDPEPRIECELPPTVTVVRQTSDEFFSGRGPETFFGGLAVDLAFIDGRHQFEFALRDFINLERHCGASSLILVHDCLPLDERTASRHRATAFWTGDVWKLIAILRRYRPDLALATVAAPPTGLAAIARLDPTSRILEEKYDQIVAGYMDLPFSYFAADPVSLLNVVPNEIDQILALQASPTANTATGGDAAVRRVREPAYQAAYGRTIAEWMIEHQERTVLSGVRWMGVTIRKNVLDCWIYQEILWEVRPEVVVEIGSLYGGSALFFCHMLDLLGSGNVLSVDLDHSRFQVTHPRLATITGNSGDPAVVSAVKRACAGKRVLVVHDADHKRDAVLRDLRAYADLVAPGSYFIVEDGVVDVFDPSTSLGWAKPGPLAATEQFVKEDGRFVVDLDRERYGITYNPHGFLKRVPQGAEPSGNPRTPAIRDTVDASNQGACRMHVHSYQEMARLVSTYLSPEASLRVLDLGSYDVNGSYKPLFDRPNWTYEGADLQPGPNVDIVLDDPYRWPFADGSYDVIVSGQAFEHIKFFWITWKEMVRVLRPGGLIFLLAPSCGPEHRYPVDCWRFYRDGFLALGELEDVEVLEADTRWTNPWGDTVGAFRKPASLAAHEERSKDVAAPVERALPTTHADVEARLARLAAIERSAGWRVVERLRRILEAVAPPGGRLFGLRVRLGQIVRRRRPSASELR